MSIEAAFFGVLAADAEPKTSKGGRSYLRCRVRVGDGDAVQWVTVTSFDDDALAAVDRMVKGARVYAEGRLSLDRWTGQDGVEKVSLSLMSFHTRLAAIGRAKPPKAKVDDTSSSPPGAAFTPPPFNDEIPF